MSCRIQLSLLTEEQKTQISLLEFKPEQSAYSKYKGCSGPDLVKFYKLSEDGKSIYLPFFFANKILGAGLNNWNLEKRNMKRISPFRKIEEKSIDQEDVFNEMMSHINQVRVCTLNVDPGYGKTFMGAALACKLKVKTVVLTHRSNIALQWIDTFSRHTNCKVYSVSKPSRNEYCVENIYDADVIISTERTSTWQKIPQDLRDNLGLLIVDEVHVFSTCKRGECLLAFQPKYILTESATIEKTNGMHAMMYAMTGKRKISRAGVTDFKVYLYRTGTSAKPGIYNSWSEKYKSILSDPNRDQQIINMTSLLVQEGRKPLILNPRIDCTERIAKKLRDIGVGAEKFCSTMKSFKDSEVLVGTVSKMGTGTDQVALTGNPDVVKFDTLIACFSYKDKPLLEQLIGRIFRSSDPVIYYMLDNDDVCDKHWRSFRNLCLTKKAKIINM